MKNILTKVFFLILGLIIGLLISKKYLPKTETISSIKESSVTKAVKEDEDICPYELKGNFSESRISFLPVPVTNYSVSEEYKKVVGTKFNERELSKGLYNPNNDNDLWL